MTARIFIKLIAGVLLIMVVALTTIDFLASRMAERAYIEGLTRDLTDKTKMLAVLGRSELVGLSPQAVREMALAAGARLTLVDPSGRVLLDSEADAAHMENHGNRPEIQAALQGAVGVVRRHSPTTGKDFLYVASSIPAGAVRLAVPLPAIGVQVNEIRMRLLGYTALAFLPAILLAAYLARKISSKLGAIIDYASTLATGNFRARLENQGRDELGELARQLNETGTKLRKLFDELQREHLELEKLERVRKDFVINVSHELRTPLASIQGYTETLLDGALHDQENNIRFLQIIRQNAERLTRLTADLLTLSRIEMKSQRLQFASYLLPDLLHEACDSIRPVADKKSIEILFDTAAPACEVFCDGEAVNQILSNLLDNAIKYTPPGGRVTISSRILPARRGRAESAEVSISDTGIGIPADDQARLFERFYRVDKARSRDLGGTGLGLAIVKHLARSLGGDVRVESAPNQGSTFSFTLPTQDPGLADSAQLQSHVTGP
jgi:two-component system, OmpR family, phosphate regulon sensor histidine kinase PhoR